MTHGAAYSFFPKKLSRTDILREDDEAVEVRGLPPLLPVDVAAARRVREKADTLLGRALERADAIRRNEDCLVIVMLMLDRDRDR